MGVDDLQDAGNLKCLGDYITVRFRIKRGRWPGLTWKCIISPSVVVPKDESRKPLLINKRYVRYPRSRLRVLYRVSPLRSLLHMLDS
jgi:hypothetical protein